MPNPCALLQDSHMHIVRAHSARHIRAGMMDKST